LSIDSLRLPDEQATLALGAALGSQLEPGLVVHLRGDLGAGKTTLARGLIRSLGYVGRVKSPTFTLVEPYRFSSLSLYHFDFYRFDDPREWMDAGLGEHFDGASVCLVEWPEKAGPALPPPDLEIRLEHATGEGRLAWLEGRTEKGRRCLERLRSGS
jgi:tRNA threonylcarbamoyladenosine biosynthesis protein TsaE